MTIQYWSAPEFFWASASLVCPTRCWTLDLCSPQSPSCTWPTGDPKGQRCFSTESWFKQTDTDTHTQTINSMIPVVCRVDICPFVQLSTGFQQTHSLSHMHAHTEPMRTYGTEVWLILSTCPCFQGFRSRTVYEHFFHLSVQIGGDTERYDTVRTDLALQLALLPQSQVLWCVSHDGEWSLGVMSEDRKLQL